MSYLLAYHDKGFPLSPNYSLPWVWALTVHSDYIASVVAYTEHCKPASSMTRLCKLQNSSRSHFLSSTISSTTRPHLAKQQTYFTLRDLFFTSQMTLLCSFSQTHIKFPSFHLSTSASAAYSLFASPAKRQACVQMSKPQAHPYTGQQHLPLTIVIMHLRVIKPFNLMYLLQRKTIMHLTQGLFTRANGQMWWTALIPQCSVHTFMGSKYVFFLHDPAYALHCMTAKK